MSSSPELGPTQGAKSGIVSGGLPVWVHARGCGASPPFPALTSADIGRRPEPCSPPRFARGGPFPLGCPQQVGLAPRCSGTTRFPGPCLCGLRWHQAQLLRQCGRAAPTAHVKDWACVRVGFAPHSAGGTGHSGPALAGRSWGSSFGHGCVVSRHAVGRKEPLPVPTGSCGLVMAWRWAEAEWASAHGGPCAGKRGQGSMGQSGVMDAEKKARGCRRGRCGAHRPCVTAGKQWCKVGAREGDVTGGA